MARFKFIDDVVLTKDTDSRRVNRNPQIIETIEGRKIAFYDKELYTGKISNSRVTFTAPTLDCLVTSGIGELNGISATWVQTPLTLNANTFSLIYCDLSGSVSATDDFPMEFMKDVIPLAAANVGASEIVYIEEFEKIGRYVYFQKQELVNSKWVWNDYEYRLNSGHTPKVRISENSNLLYVNYIRDGDTNLRIIDVTDELSFEYLRSYTIQTGEVITLDRDLNRKLQASVNSGRVQNILTDVELGYLFTTPSLAYTGDEFGDYTLVFRPGIFNANGWLYIDGFMNIYILSGDEFVIEKQYPLDEVLTYRFVTDWEEWTYTSGTKYVGLEITQGYYNRTYYTNSADYIVLDFPEVFDYFTLTDDTWTGLIRQPITSASVGSGNSTINKTAEFGQLFNAPAETLDGSVAPGNGEIQQVAEFEQLFDDPTDNFNANVSSGRCRILLL